MCQYEWKRVNDYCIMFVNTTGVKKSSWITEIAIVKVIDNKITDTFISKVKPLSPRKDIKEKFKDYMQYKSLTELLPEIQDFIQDYDILGWCNDFVDKIIYHDAKVWLDNHFIDLFIPYKRYFKNHYGEWFCCSLENVYKKEFEKEPKVYNFENPYERCLVCKELYERQKDFNKYLSDARKQAHEYKVKHNLL